MKDVKCHNLNNIVQIYFLFLMVGIKNIALSLPNLPHGCTTVNKSNLRRSQKFEIKRISVFLNKRRHNPILY